MVGCENNLFPSHNKEYVAFQTNKGGKWGLIGLDGEVLFENKFDSVPSVANGMLFVEGEKGLYDLYTATKDPSLIGSGYPWSGVGAFNKSGVAAVSRKEKPIEIIDVDGNVKFILDTIEGRKITSIFPFNDNGLARFKVGDLQGCIDETGKVIVSPKYYRLGIFPKCIIGLSYKYEEYYLEENFDSITWDVLDLSGNKVCELDKLYRIIGTSRSDRYISVSKEIDDDNYTTHEVYRLIDEKGDPVNNIKMLKVGSASEDMEKFCYLEGKTWGVMDLTGKVLLKPIYDYISFLSDEILCVTNDGDGKNKRMIDLDGNNIGSGRYHSLGKFENNSAIAEIEKDKWVVIDKDGNIQKELPEIYRLARKQNKKVYNNDVNIDAYLKSLDLSKYGIDGISFESEWYPISLYAGRINNESLGDVVITTRINRDDPQIIEYGKYCNDIVTYFKLIFQSSNDFDEEQPVHPILINFYTYNFNQMAYHLDELYSKLQKEISQYGYRVKSNGNASVYYNAGISYQIWKTSQMVGMSMGKVSPEFYDIEQFKIENNDYE